MMFKKLIPGALAASLIALSLFFVACNVSDPHEHDEGELITSARLVLTHAASGSVDTIWFRDADGPGGLAPTEHDTIRLFPGRTYTASLSFLNESNPANIINMTDEILEEAHDHQVFYTVAGSGLSVAYADQDENDLPIGLLTTFTTTAGAPASLTITLKHQPGLKGANSTINTGETDVAIAFPVVMTNLP
jgi:hypothetical protein